MVFTYDIQDASKRTISIGQIHVEDKGITLAGQTRELAKALESLSDWLQENELSRLPASVYISIA